MKINREEFTLPMKNIHTASVDRAVWTPVRSRKPRTWVSRHAPTLEPLAAETIAAPTQAVAEKHIDTSTYFLNFSIAVPTAIATADTLLRPVTGSFRNTTPNASAKPMLVAHSADTEAIGAIVSAQTLSQ